MMICPNFPFGWDMYPFPGGVILWIILTSHQQNPVLDLITNHAKESDRLPRKKTVER